MKHENTAKTAQKLPGLVPKLRFPEFKDSGAWLEKKLNDICEVNPLTDAVPEYFVYIDLESVDAGKLSTRKIISSKEAPSRAQRLLSYGDVIFQIVRPYQRNNFHFKVKDEFSYVASTGYAQLRANESGDFLYQLVHTDSFVERVISKCTGSSYPAINSTDLAQINVITPSFPEQQKIADCLDSVDELISAHSQKLEALKTHKKGLMQNLFPAEGETVPKHRFPEFKDAGAWEGKKIGSICGFIVPGRNKPEHFDGDIPWITTPDIEQNKCVSQSKKNLCVSKEEAKAVGSKIVPENAIIMSCVGDLGLLAIAGCELVINQQLHAFIANEGYNYRFLLYALTIKKPYMEKVATKTAVPYMNKDTCNSIPVSVPSLPEQQKIADCLASLDDLITAQTQKIDALKQHKKGLMQQLFPVVES